jgi:hypothetical protein
MFQNEVNEGFKIANETVVLINGTTFRRRRWRCPVQPSVVASTAHRRLRETRLIVAAVHMTQMGWTIAET